MEAIRAFYKAPQVSVFIRKDGQGILRLAARADIQRVIDHSSKILQGYKFSQLVQFVEQDRMHNSSGVKSLPHTLRSEVGRRISVVVTEKGIAQWKSDGLQH